jgi:hypothetical protein
VSQSALGFRVKSGWAMACLLGGVADGPKLIDRRKVHLADPEAPESIQPYHAGLDGPRQKGTRGVAELVRLVERFAAGSIGELIDTYEQMGHRPRVAGVVVSSLGEPAKIANDHIRAHAEEGRLFRVVLENGLRGRGLDVRVLLEKNLLANAVEVLKISEERVKEQALAFRRDVKGSWRTEEKAAAVAAWMALAGMRNR